MTNYEFLSIGVAVISVGVASVVAFATFKLVTVTKILADKTADMSKAMDESKAKAHVVVTLKAYTQAQHLVEAFIENTGSATAYDINIETLSQHKDGNASRHFIPFRKMSILKPNDIFASCVCNDPIDPTNQDGKLSTVTDLTDCIFTVTISWAHEPKSIDRYSHTYQLSVLNLGDAGRLDEPIVAIAKNLSDIKESITKQSPP